jgi:hypothetical protein
MPLNLYANIYASGSVPNGWTPSQGGVIKYPVRNKELLRYLRQLAPGRWQKVIKRVIPAKSITSSINPARSLT